MDSWEKFNKISLPKKTFYSNLAMENITDVDYKHPKRFWKNFELQSLGQYLDLYIQTDTLAQIFESFRYQCLKIYESANFLSAPSVDWQACLKKTKVEFKLIDTDILPMPKKGLRGGICYTVHRYAKASNKYMKYCEPNTELSYHMY